MTVEAMGKDLPSGKSDLTKEDDWNADSKEYKLSTSVSLTTADLVSACIGDVLTYMEASLEPGPKTEALKKLVKERMYSLTRAVQHQVYYAFGIEPYQLGDSMYIKDVIDGTEKNADGTPAIS